MKHYTKNVNYENEVNICLEFLYDNNYGTPCTRCNNLASFVKVFSKIISVISFNIVMFDSYSILRLIYFTDSI